MLHAGSIVSLYQRTAHVESDRGSDSFEFQFFLGEAPNYRKNKQRNQSPTQTMINMPAA